MFTILECIKEDGDFEVGQLFPAVNHNDGLFMSYNRADGGAGLMFLLQFGFDIDNRPVFSGVTWECESVFAVVGEVDDKCDLPSMRSKVGVVYGGAKTSVSEN